jgi:hypothetical protein
MKVGEFYKCIGTTWVVVYELKESDNFDKIFGKWKNNYNHYGVTGYNNKQYPFVLFGWNDEDDDFYIDRPKTDSQPKLLSVQPIPHVVSRAIEELRQITGQIKKRFVVRSYQNHTTLSCVDENDTFCNYSTENNENKVDGKKIVGTKIDWNVWKVIDISPEAYFTLTGLNPLTPEMRVSEAKKKLEKLFGCQSKELMVAMEKMEYVFNTINQSDFGAEIASCLTSVLSGMDLKKAKSSGKTEEILKNLKIISENIKL